MLAACRVPILLGPVDGTHHGIQWSIEIQNVLDEYAGAVVQLKTQLMNLDFTIAYLMERFAIKPDEVKEFMTRKLAEFTTNAQPEKSTITLN